MKVLFMFIFNTLLDFVIIPLFTCRVINSMAVVSSLGRRQISPPLFMVAYK